MTEKPPVPKKGFSADWLLRGSLTKIGDTFDRFTGRKWVPSSSLATSELIERIKKLLDAEAKIVPSKGTVVPHNIKLKIQWDKFSTDAEDAIKKLEFQLLAATADHINDSLYYTYAPVSLEIKPDYFIEGVKLMVSFDRFTDEDRDVEMSLTIPSIKVTDMLSDTAPETAATGQTYIARFRVNAVDKEKRLEFPPAGRISVGRTGPSGLVIEDTSVSKIHASLSIGEDGVLSVADTGSTNGTFINDERIAYGKATRLVADDRVKFGTVEVSFEQVEQSVVEAKELEAEPKEEVVEIDGFEFKRKASEREVESLPAIPIPDETLKVKEVTGMETAVPKDPTTKVNRENSAPERAVEPKTDVNL